MRSAGLYNAADGQTRDAASLQEQRWLEGISFATEFSRPRDYCRLPGGDHAIRPALSKAAALHARLFPRRPKYSVVGHWAFNRRSGDQYSDHHQYSWAGLRFE